MNFLIFSLNEGNRAPYRESVASALRGRVKSREGFQQ
jgi:hypothetical protein